jgi:hypothetical protein
LSRCAVLAYWRSAALLGGFYGPGVVRGTILVQNFVVNLGVDVLRIDEEPVDVEDACADWQEMGGVRHLSDESLTVEE